MSQPPTAPVALHELRAWPHWVVYRVEERGGKATKVPYMAATPSRRASSTDPETWGTYEQAVETFGRKRCAGVGYVFSARDEYTGIDLDACVDETGTIHPEAAKIVVALDSYTELSPTGTGLHIIVRGRINGDRKRTAKTGWGGDFESYDDGRFFTVTGRHVTSTPGTIEARQKELDAVRNELFPMAEAEANGRSRSRSALQSTPALDDVALEEKIRASKQGGKYAELFDRGAPEGRESEADLSLANILAFWIGPDEARIDAWFRRSALMREKWDDKRGETTYGGYTIARALEGRTDFYGQKNASAARFTRPADDDVEMAPGQEMSGICGLIDDPFVSGWRSSRQAKCRVVLTTQSGAVLDLESWKTATSSPPALAQEIGVQLGVEVTFRKENISRLNVLMGRFCQLVEATTIRDRARELGEAFLQEAEQWPVDMADQASRYAAFVKLQQTSPATKARAEGLSIAAASIVLADVSGKRFVRVQWFVDYVKAGAVSGTATAIVEQMEAPGWWARPNEQGKYKATEPGGAGGGKVVFHRLFEVPPGWESGA